MPETSLPEPKRGYNRFLLLVAGLGGLLYGVDVGIIGGALPYLEATSGLTAGQLSIIVAAVLLGSVVSTLFAGLLADWMGRRMLMVVSGLAFVVSIPVIALAHGYSPLFFGRLLQGISGGLIGVVVPLYLAECLTAARRGQGTAAFQWLLTLGIVMAALIGIYYSYRVEAMLRTADAAALYAYKDQAWRRIFWVSMPPGILFVLGSFFVAESPRWLFARRHPERALASLLRSRTAEQAASELEEMQAVALSRPAQGEGRTSSDSLLRRRYVIPFLLTCVILACNTATGINSVVAYDTNILMQSGLSDLHAHWGYVLFTVVNFLATIVGMSLIDRKGRRFLFMMGTAGVAASMVFVGGLFRTAERDNVDCSRVLQAAVGPGQTLRLSFDPQEARRLLAAGGPSASRIDAGRASLAVIYSYGDYTAAAHIVRSDEPGGASIVLDRAGVVPATRIEAFFKNPFGDLAEARTAPLRIERATVGRIPDPSHGWLVGIGLYIFVWFYASGPGVAVWLALSELMPTRIRSNGMSIALVGNQLVSTILAGIFLPVASRHGYSFMFFLFASFASLYFLVATLFLPETKGKTLEEIEHFFERAHS